MGLSSKEMIGAFLVLTIILCLLFAFIFLGIGAFSQGSSFEAVINSIIAMSAGGATGQDRSESKTQRQFKLKGSMDRVMNMLQNAM
jgi:glycerol-3-phosphate acyltransferase PlsY